MPTHYDNLFSGQDDGLYGETPARAKRAAGPATPRPTPAQPATPASGFDGAKGGGSSPEVNAQILDNYGPAAAAPAADGGGIVGNINQAVANPPTPGALPTPGFDHAQMQAVADAFYGLSAPRIQEGTQRNVDFADNRLTQRGIPLSSSGARATIGDIYRSGDEALGNLSLASVLGGAEHGLRQQGQAFNQGFANQGANFGQQLALNRLPFEQYGQILGGVQPLRGTSEYGVASGDYQGLSQADRTARANRNAALVGAGGEIGSGILQWLLNRNNNE